MGKTGSPCFKCSQRCYPVKINPPNKNNRPKRTTEHMCDAPDCYNAHMYGFGRGGRGRRGRGNKHKTQSISITILHCYT